MGFQEEDKRLYAVVVVHFQLDPRRERGMAPGSCPAVPVNIRVVFLYVHLEMDSDHLFADYGVWT